MNTYLTRQEGHLAIPRWDLGLDQSNYLAPNFGRDYKKNWRNVILNWELERDIFINLVLSSPFLNNCPTLGCDIQGILAMRFFFQYRPPWFQDFLAICYWPLESTFSREKRCVRWIKLALRITHPVKTLWSKFTPIWESANERNIFHYCLYNETCWSTIVILQTVRYLSGKKQSSFRNIPRFHTYWSIEGHAV